MTQIQTKHINYRRFVEQNVGGWADWRRVIVSFICPARLWLLPPSHTWTICLRRRDAYGKFDVLLRFGSNESNESLGSINHNLESHCNRMRWQYSHGNTLLLQIYKTDLNRLYSACCPLQRYCFCYWFMFIVYFKSSLQTNVMEILTSSNFQ